VTSDAQADPKVHGSISVVLVSFRTPQFLRDCLMQLSSEPAVAQVIVVDNASGDDSAALVEREFPDVELVRNSKNVGFARAVNQALPHCRGELVLLLNPDTVLDQGAIDELVRQLNAQPRIAAVGPAIRHSSGRLRVLSAGRQPTVWRMLTHATLLSRLSRGLPFLEGLNLIAGVHDDRQRDVEWLTGACFLVRRNALDAVGGLSERWFMYAEDLELCLRLRRAGWRLAHVPSAQVVHHMGASADRTKPPSTAWAVTLHDFYRTDISSGVIADLFWRGVFASQLVSRAAYYRLRSATGRRSAPKASAAWQREAAGFIACAVAVLRGAAPDH
jgi:N-acetylglucosaminyl-diphospho-decaprenol L-rhamnosyltransferase